MSWNESRGFGFVSPDSGGNDVFVHASAFRNRNRQPQVKDRVTYSLSKDDLGRLRAVTARFAGDKQFRRSRSRRRSMALALAIGFLVTVGFAATLGLIHEYILYAYLLASVVTIAAYGIDKTKAQSGAWRLQESSLHLLSIAGGWPGAILAQEYLRHKSSKAAFRKLFWVTVVLNLTGLGWLLLTEDGEAMLRRLLELLASVA